MSTTDLNAKPAPAVAAVELYAREWVFADLTEIIANHAPLPEHIQITDIGTITLRLLDDDRAAADVWAAELRLPPCKDNYNEFLGEPGQRWISYGSNGKHELWPGWSIRIWCSVSVDVDASAHWTGPLLPSQERGYFGERAPELAERGSR